MRGNSDAARRPANIRESGAFFVYPKFDTFGFRRAFFGDFSAVLQSKIVLE